MGWFDKKLKGLSLNDKKVANTVSEIETCGVFKSVLAEVMTENLYTRIIHKCFSRAILPADVEKSAFNMTIYDSYSPFKNGLASIITFALVKQKQIFIKLSKTDNEVILFSVLTDPTETEKTASDVIELDFTKFRQIEIINLLYCLIQAILTAIDKGVTISGAMLFKLHKLHEMTQNDSTQKVLAEQLTQLNDSITQGNAGYIDANSDIVFPAFDAAPSQIGIDLIYGMIANITGLPLSFINAETVGGLGSTEGSDNQRLNDAIEFYYYNVVNNILFSVYNKVFEFKQFVSDINGLISMFAFIETTTLLTNAGKLKFMRNNTGFNDEDININQSSSTTPTVNENIDNE